MYPQCIFNLRALIANSLRLLWKNHDEHLHRNHQIQPFALWKAIGITNDYISSFRILKRMQGGLRILVGMIHLLVIVCCWNVMGPPKLTQDLQELAIFPRISQDKK